MGISDEIRISEFMNMATSCRHQITQCTDRRVLHFAEALA